MASTCQVQRSVLTYLIVNSVWHNWLFPPTWNFFFLGFQNSIPSYCFFHLSCCFSLFPLLLLTSEDLISQDSALDSILFFVNRKHLGFSSSLIHSYGFNTLYMPTPKFNAPVLTSVLNFKQFLFVIGISNAYLILNMSQIKSLTLPSILLLLSSSLVQ